MTTVRAIVSLLEQIAPIDLAEEWDNVGLLAGHPDSAVQRVLCALELNEGVINEAIAKDAQMIVTHHPIMFRGRKNLNETDGEGRLLCDLIRNELALYAMHTNFDNVHPGVNDALANVLNLFNQKPLEHGMILGEILPVRLDHFTKRVEERLGGVVRVYGSPDRLVHTVAVLGGAGEDYAAQALQHEADVFITGEMSYHKAMDALAGGLCILEAGHAATEKPSISYLTGALQRSAKGVQLDIDVICSTAMLFL